MYYDTKLVFSHVHTQKWFSYLYYDMKWVFVLVKFCFCPCTMTQNLFSSFNSHTNFVFIFVLWHKIGFRHYSDTKWVFVHVLWYEIVPILWHKIGFCPSNMTQNYFSSMYYDRDCLSIVTQIFSYIVTQNCARPMRKNWSVTRNWFSFLYCDTKLVFVCVLWHESDFRWCTITLKLVFVLVLWHKIDFLPYIDT